MISTTTKMKTVNRGLIGLAIGLACLAIAALAAESVSPPRAIIEGTVRDVLAVLSDSEQTTAQRRSEIEKIAQQRFDFRTMTKLVLARNWRKLSEAQQGEFVEEFTAYLAKNYSSRIDEYDQEELAVVDERTEPRGDITVRTKVIGGENDGALIDYRMRERNGEWKVIDIIIEGISLISNFRDQFREAMSAGGPTRLLEKLREKNAEFAAAS